MASLYPTPHKASLHAEFLGQNLKDVAAPAAVIDVAAVRRNCEMMLQTAKALGVGFRAHVKTHKVSWRIENPVVLEMGQCYHFTQWSGDRMQ